MLKTRLIALVLLVIGLAVGYYVYTSAPFKLGLDLRGGSHLIYQADVSELSPDEITESMSALREVIERRINVFGVAEPVIQVEQAGIGADAAHRLIVELPGVTDVKQAAAMISATPVLEFRVQQGEEFVPTELTGRYLERATVQFTGQLTGPSVSLEFNQEGKRLFAELTKANVGNVVAIYLDGQPISAPVVREEIKDGRAEITGQFSIDEAKELVRNLNLGALPVPIDLVLSEAIGPTLGQEALDRGIQAGLLGFALVALFMIIWYRVPGLIAMLSLVLYVVLILAIFKLFAVVLTAAAIAGLILSFGMALDANILISERLKEELRAGRHLHEAIREGFSRAWFSIRDANLSSLISAVVIFWLGTSLMRGFAFTLLIGIVVSMFTAIYATRVLLLASAPAHSGRLTRALFKCGFK